jgi:ATP-binding cassette subfamily F protein uup
MPLLSVDRACLAFGHVALLDHCDLQIDARERIGLIGRNGTGKSSLLKAIAGMLSLDDGGIWRQPGLHVTYVAQEPEFSVGETVFDAVASGLGTLGADVLAYHDAVLKVGAGGTAALDNLQMLQARLEAADGWRMNARVEQAISRLELDGSAAVEILSGGGRKRVALARALVAEPELLLLDEPTNHLDLDGILWLEELLRDFAGAVVLITHDRSFLDSVVTRIVELDRGALTSFPGRFAEYQLKKESMLHAENLANARADKMLAQEEVWIRKGVEARRTRSVGRIARLEQLRVARAERRDVIGKANIRLARGDESGKLVAELEKVSKHFGDKSIVRNFSCRIQRGDKIGLIGPNGCGKTTLLRLILGVLEADEGTVRLGSRVEVAYFDQFRGQLDPEATLADVISPGSEYVEISTGNDRTVRQHVIGYLGDFLFAPERARSPVKALSGGERARLLLARLFARPANVLVLDEPTNDLDIETLELLENLLQDYSGTVFLVSHDRTFLDNVVTQSIACEGDGRWQEYVGGYADWLRQRPQPVQNNLPAGRNQPSIETSAAKVGDGGTALVARPISKKLSFKEQRELEQLPGKIAALEAQQKSLHAQLADSDFYQGPVAEVRAAQERSTLLDDEVMALMVRWEALETRVTG